MGAQIVNTHENIIKHFKTQKIVLGHITENTSWGMANCGQFLAIITYSPREYQRIIQLVKGKLTEADLHLYVCKIVN